MAHEILTLQVGHFANFVGTHWWNLQDASFVYDQKDVQYEKEINHDVLFREGRTLVGEVTYTPRLISFDLKGSLNTLKQEGCLYDLPDTNDDVNWCHDVTMHKETAPTKNDFLEDLEREETEALGGSSTLDQKLAECDLDKDASEVVSTPRVFGRTFYDLDDSVTVWSDYLKVHLHPRSIHLLHQYQHQNSQEPFDLHTYGQSAFRDPATLRAVDDKLHYFLEECDHLQGIQVISDLHDGFGGVSSALLENLEDELGNKHCLVFGVTPSTFPDSTSVQDMYRSINLALSIDRLYTHSSALVPLSLAEGYGRTANTRTAELIKYTPGLMYHESAILATALDTATLPYRRHGDPTQLSHLTQALTPAGRKVLRLYTCLPLPARPHSPLIDLLGRLRTQPWTPLTPGADARSLECDCQSVVVRGLKLNARTPGARGTEPPEDLLTEYLRDTSRCSHNALCTVSQRCKTTTPFPHIFSPRVGKDGSLCDTDRPSNTGVECVPQLTSLQCSGAVRASLAPLVGVARAVKLGRLHHFTQSGLEVDEYTETLARLDDLVDTYT